MAPRSAQMAVFPNLSMRTAFDLTAFSSHLRRIIFPAPTEPPVPPIPPDPPHLSGLIILELPLQYCTPVLADVGMWLPSSLKSPSSKSSLEKTRPLQYALMSVSPVLILVRYQNFKLLLWPPPPSSTVHVTWQSFGFDVLSSENFPDDVLILGLDIYKLLGNLFKERLSSFMERPI